MLIGRRGKLSKDSLGNYSERAGRRGWTKHLVYLIQGEGTFFYKYLAPCEYKLFKGQSK